MKKILFVLPFLPYPLESGGHQALFNGIAAIKDDYDVYIAYEALDDEDYREAVMGFIKKIPSAKLFPLLQPKPPLPPKYPKWRHFIHRMKETLKKGLGMNDIPFIPVNEKDEDEKICDWWLRSVSPLRKKWTEHISVLCATHHFDIVQVEMPWLVSQVLTLPDKTRKLFVHHEIGFVRRQLEMSGKSPNKYMEACRTFADYNEVHLLNKYDMVVTLSSDDACKLQEQGVSVPVRSSFAIIDAGEKMDYHSSDGKRLVFVGPDTHAPNLVGITWFLDNCWHRLHEIDSSYQLDIVGKWSEHRKKEYKGKYANVEFLGFVDDLGAALKNAIMIVPITIGSGIRMKILEAASNGVPFVSTTVGAEGIPVKSGVHCFLADTPDEFVDAIVKMQNEGVQLKFVENSKKLTKAHYSLEALRENRLHIYNQLWGSL